MKRTLQAIVLPKQLDNLLVPVTPSASHVAWGTVRQTPTLLHLCEAAAYAVVLAHRTKTKPGFLDVRLLQQMLVEKGIMISFFNDFDMGTDAPYVTAVQFLGTQGFFATYDARPEDSLTLHTAQKWAKIVRKMQKPSFDVLRLAQKVGDFDSGGFVKVSQWCRLLAQAVQVSDVDPCGLPVNQHISRGDACRIVYQMLCTESGFEQRTVN